jgi:hypothetical protein
LTLPRPARRTAIGPQAGLQTSSGAACSRIKKGNRGSLFISHLIKHDQKQNNCAVALTAGDHSVNMPYKYFGQHIY